jgi:protein TonB
MIMMTKKRTSALASIKMLMVIPVLAIVFLAVSASKSESVPPPPPPPPPISTGLNDNIKIASDESGEESGTLPFVVVEEMPSFPGGDVALLKYIGKNTIYPEIAKENNIQGKVIIRFCVTEKGSVSRISVLKGVDPELNDEAIRVVKTLPAFKPGRQGGKPVPVWYMVPITFSLK